MLSLLDTNKDGHIDYDEFLIGVRGQLNPKRQAMVDKAFLKFDKDCSGVITANDIRGVFKADMHPKVQAGQMTPAEAFNEFLGTF